MIKKTKFFLLTFFVVGATIGCLVFFLINKSPLNSVDFQVVKKHQAGETFFTYIIGETGKIAVSVVLPKTARFGDCAPVVVYVPTFFTPESFGFEYLSGLEDQGIIQVTLLYPGRHDKGNMVSEGQNDYGGINSLKALRDTILFAAGEKKNLGGFSLGDLSEIVPDFNNVGLYAFSHPGIVATNVMAVYGKQLSAVDYFVGRENPTMDIISALEIGYFSEDEEKKEIKNSAYIFPDSYLSTGLAVDYSSVRWSKTLNAPYFDFNNNSQPDGSDFLLTRPAPLLFNKRAYSDELLLAVQQNGLAAADWPEDLATPEEAARWWGDNRETVNSYSRLKNLNFKVMLVFGAVDHVQTEPDKPHIHQAYDGFNQTAGLWIRLNPDQSYVVLLNKNLATDYQDRAANTEPTDWLKVGQGAYSSKIGNTLVPLAAVMEMADRTHVNNWQTNLTSILAK